MCGGNALLMWFIVPFVSSPAIAAFFAWRLDDKAKRLASKTTPPNQSRSVPE
jgi:hypothetical protein